MNRDERSALVSIPAALAVASVIGWAGSFGGTAIQCIPVYGLLYAIAFGIQWVAFLPSYLLRSERFYDITGSVTYITVMGLAVLLGRPADARAFLLFGLVVVWAARLGTFLLRRVLASGKDARFDRIKTSFARLLLAWTLQGLWVSLTLAAALAAGTSGVQRPLGVPAFVGLTLWVVGFGIEALADEQKRRFRRDPTNKGAFICSGLWAWSRHPNYFGEILLWVGVAVIAAPVLRGWQWMTMISPFFVLLLLTRISGIPLLERQADERWGGQEDYEAYKRRTSILVPRPPRSKPT